jgi:FtsZ-interacting cell division protein YlmF
VDFKRIAKNLGDAQDVITSLQKQTGGNPTADKDEEYSSDENVDQAEMKASEAEPALPEEAPEEQEVPPQEEPEMPKTQSQDKMVNDLSDLESMVADIAAEIGSEDQEEN